MALSHEEPKGGRAPLSAERIEIEALALIEREGLAAFSTRKLAAALGCEAMSIYHYFPSKQHLMDALIDRVIGEMPPIPGPGLPWIERLEQLARDWRRVVTARPNLFVFVGTHRLNTPKCLVWLNSVLGLFAECGLTREDGVRLFRAFGYYLMGAALDETSGYARGPSTVAPTPPEIMARDFPNVAAAGRYFQSSEYDATFDLGLRLLLEGAARMIGERRRDAAE
jgi:AcrR family transcriptional regulator